MTYDATNFNPAEGTPVDIQVEYSPQFSNLDTLFWTEHNTANELENSYGLENSFIAVEDVGFPIHLVYHKDKYFCYLNDVINFDVNNECSSENIYISNVFTPNGDGVNDIFEIKGYIISSITEFIIIDRFGKEIVNLENIDMKNGKSSFGWNGMDKNGVLCNNGVYVYHYIIKCINGGEFQAAGNITLIR